MSGRTGLQHRTRKPLLALFLLFTGITHAADKELILDRGGHGPGVVIEDNLGQLRQQKLDDLKKAGE